MSPKITENGSQQMTSNCKKFFRINDCQNKPKALAKKKIIKKD